ncbi:MULTISPECIES: amidohydrolase family protein [unclassified Pseudodesulfovibrio]|uniref:amidohydrolase family protein n=1 Tax=unclassified Pseudodesulfovibrio TaxID=2661612 RepID=UPI000FEC0946|nr:MULTISPECIES: amidohydrolase family protein [unclassified Pseudodesulfovibrio]MCJ2166010.1 amidohydrolase family protein [Pseudodesulfovibrio sp. S3-i]RWU02551.1 amidohydrolase [Pseudodesulfovibrio sp. S3]
MALSRRAFLTTLTGLGLLAPIVSTASPALPEGTYGIVGNVFTGNDTPALCNHAVLVCRGRIEAVVPADTVSDRPLLKLRDAAVMPGVVNAHCHGIHTASDRRERWLEAGVTAIGDVGSPLTAMTQLAHSPTGTTTAAALAGPMLTPPGGYPLPVHSPKFALEIPSPAAGTDAVKRLADQGATQIKISFEPGVLPDAWPRFDPRTAQAICDTARRLGLNVRCHVEDLSGLEPALNAGVDTVEHVPHRWHDQGAIRPVLTSGQEPIPHYCSLLERMVREQVILTPTLDVFSRTPWNGPALFEPVRAFHALGGRIALGNDYPYRRTDAGMPIREMRLLAQAGLDGAAVIRAATSTGAAACGFTDRGTLSPGRIADILVVQGDPALDPGILHTPLHVVKDGVFIC